MTTQQMHSSALKTATIAGLAGAGLALLFAPRSGQETRARIRNRADRAKHQAEDTLQSAKTRVEESAQAAKELKDRAEQAVEAGRKSAKEKYQELRTSKESEPMPSDLPEQPITKKEDEV